MFFTPTTIFPISIEFERLKAPSRTEISRANAIFGEFFSRKQ